MKDALLFVGFVVAGLAALFLIAGPIAALTEKLAAPATVAQIEEVRAAVQRVDPNEAEDVMGQAVDWNRTIASARVYNDRWWACLFIPNEIAECPLIEIPKR